MVVGRHSRGISSDGEAHGVVVEGGCGKHVAHCAVLECPAGLTPGLIPLCLGPHPGLIGTTPVFPGMHRQSRAAVQVRYTWEHPDLSWVLRQAYLDKASVCARAHDQSKAYHDTPVHARICPGIFPAMHRSSKAEPGMPGHTQSCLSTPGHARAYTGMPVDHARIAHRSL